ncbi:MAG: DUF4430 domain-containing protein [bacterium]
MAQKNKILILPVVLASAAILIFYGRVNGFLPLKIENIKSAPIAEKSAADDFKVKLEIGGKEYQSEIEQGGTVYDLMKNSQADGKLSFSAKEYAGMGALVEEINGIKNNAETGKFWIFYVNGQPSAVGISSYVLKNNDAISWKYEAYGF